MGLLLHADLRYGKLLIMTYCIGSNRKKQSLQEKEGRKIRRAYRIIVSIGLLILTSFAVTTAVFADNLYIDVDFVPNSIFSTYDVNLTLDGQPGCAFVVGEGSYD